VTPYAFTKPLATERLVLRLLTAGDVDDVHAYQSDPEVTRYELYDPRTREEVAEKLAGWAKATTLEKDDDYLQLAIDLDGRVIGEIYFVLKRVKDELGEIGWSLHPGFQGKGYATEAASATLDLAFRTLELHRVMADLDPRNTPSIALCERLGMRSEAHFVEDLWFKGEWGDTAIYGILAREWLALSPSSTAQ
jgi:RimJ/RimL family protein N-acetyltransferase